MNRNWHPSDPVQRINGDGLTGRESEIVEITEHSDDQLIPNIAPNKCLVGKLHSDKSPNGFHLLEVMKKAWKSLPGMTAREWKRDLFLFSFKSVEDRDWVLKRQPWHFDNQVFLVAPLAGNSQPSSIDLSHCSFWVRAYDLPLHCMTVQSLKSIAQKVGVIEDMDANGNYSGSFIRFKTRFDVSVPLMRGLTFSLEGKKYWIPLKYESLPAFCFNCGVMGHQSRACEKAKEDDEAQGFEDLKYGAWLKASPLKRVRVPDQSNEILSADVRTEILSKSTLTVDNVTPETTPKAEPNPKTILPKPYNTSSNIDSLSTEKFTHPDLITKYPKTIKLESKETLDSYPVKPHITYPIKQHNSSLPLSDPINPPRDVLLYTPTSTLISNLHSNLPLTSSYPLKRWSRISRSMEGKSSDVVIEMEQMCQKKRSRLGRFFAYG